MFEATKTLRQACDPPRLKVYSLFLGLSRTSAGGAGHSAHSSSGAPVHSPKTKPVPEDDETVLRMAENGGQGPGKHRRVLVGTSCFMVLHIQKRLAVNQPVSNENWRRINSSFPTTGFSIQKLHQQRTVQGLVSQVFERLCHVGRYKK
jgi:hypothetical protein|uniref:Uncharacterized protein n=1 Tax=Eutreptiella gymnastica TaxID=73025 RepID=A0A7S4FQ86_9EUGL